MAILTRNDEKGKEKSYAFTDHPIHGEKFLIGYTNRLNVLMPSKRRDCASAD
jgi:hypothetical protein